LFFFSSRRRHTRSKRDWSSDVCSSDLICSVYDSTALIVTSSNSDVTVICFFSNCQRKRSSTCLICSSKRNNEKDTYSSSASSDVRISNWRERFDNRSVSRSIMCKYLFFSDSDKFPSLNKAAYPFICCNGVCKSCDISVMNCF